MTSRTSRRRTSVRRSSRHLRHNTSRPEVTKAVRKVAAAYLKLYSIPVWRDPALRPAYNAAWQQMSDANAVVRSLARTENERHMLNGLITKAEAVAAAKAKHNLRYTSRGVLRANSTRYTTRTPVRPELHVDEHSSEAEIAEAWRSGRIGTKTLQRIQLARPAVYRKLCQLAQNGRRSSRRISPQAIERAFGLQPGETYEYEDAEPREELTKKIHGHDVVFTAEPTLGSVTAWVKWLGNIAHGRNLGEAEAKAEAKLREGGRALLGQTRKAEAEYVAFRATQRTSVRRNSSRRLRRNGSFVLPPDWSNQRVVVGDIVHSPLFRGQGKVRSIVDDVAEVQKELGGIATVPVVDLFVKPKGTSLRRNGVVQPLYGFHDVNSAYVVADYPYGFHARTQIRYWLEMSPKKGFRFVSQTMDPKRGAWNKPKASTYAEFAGAMYLDEKGHVQWTGLGMYSESDKVLAFLHDFPGADKSVLKLFLPAKLRSLQKLVKLNDQGLTGWTMNGIPTELTPGEAARNREELARWQAVAAAL